MDKYAESQSIVEKLPFFPIYNEYIILCSWLKCKFDIYCIK